MIAAPKDINTRLCLEDIAMIQSPAIPDFVDRYVDQDDEDDIFVTAEELNPYYAEPQASQRRRPQPPTHPDDDDIEPPRQRRRPQPPTPVDGDSGIAATKSKSPAKLSVVRPAPKVRDLGIDSVDGDQIVRVTTADQLPRSLRGRDDCPVPGWLFGHQAAMVNDLGLVSYEVVRQYRPDEPMDDRKYVFPTGVSAPITVLPSQQRKVGAAKTLLIVEGTKQAHVAAAHAPDDVLVVGIAGCWNWKVDGAPSKSLEAMVAEGGRVVVAFDADVRSNQSVWLAADELRKALKAMGAKRVSFAEIPQLTGEKSTGLDDYVMTRSEAERDRVVRNLVNGAGALGVKPAAKSKSLSFSARTTLTVWPDDGVIAYPKEDTTGEEVPDLERVAAGFAVGFIERRVSIHDLDPDAPREIVFDAEINLQQSPDDVYALEVRNDEFGNLARLMERVGERGEGTSAWISPNVEKLITATIRNSCPIDIESKVVYARTGQLDTDDGPRFLLPGGAIQPGCDDLDTRYCADGIPAAVRDKFSWRHNGGVKSAVEHVMSIHRLHLHPRPWIVGSAMAAYAATGAPPRGMIVLSGQPGSGKTSIAQGLMGYLGPEFARSTTVMAHTDTSGAQARDDFDAFHGHLVLRDDYRSRSSLVKGETQTATMESESRWQYGGPEFKPRLKRFDGTAWRPRRPVMSYPAIIATSELPASAVMGASSVERCVDVTVERNAKPEGFMDAIRSPKLSEAFYGMVRWLMNGPELTTWTEISEHWQKVRDDCKHQMMSKAGVGQAMDRVYDVVSFIPAGWRVWTDFAVSVGAMTTDEAEVMMRSVIKMAEDIVAGSVSASERNTTGVIDSLQALIAGGSYYLGDKDIVGKRCLGRLLERREGEEVGRVAILPSIAAAALGISESEFEAQMSPLVERGAKSVRQRQRFEGGLRVGCYVIPDAAWVGKD